MKYTTLQRWVYVSGDSVPNALRALAQEIERFQVHPYTNVPDDEYIYDYSMDTNVEISYSEDSDNDECYRAGICMSWKIIQD